MSRRTLTLLLSTVLAVALTVAALVARVPYVVYAAGPTFDTLGTAGEAPVIDIKGREVFPTDGQLDLTTVEVRSDQTLSQAMYNWFRRDRAVVPRELVFPPGQSRDQVDAENERAMVVSKNAATTAALTELGVPVTVSVAGTADGSAAAGRLQSGDVLTAVDGAAVTSPEQLRDAVSDRAVGAPVQIGYRRDGTAGKVDLTTQDAGDGRPRAIIGVETAVTDFPFEVDIALEDVGGPSAGLMFALGIVDKLGRDSVTGGRYIAGTGTIDADGRVGPIGGIQQKLIGARDKGAVAFLVPAANCADAAASIPAGLQLLKVTTLDDALSGLETLAAGGAPPSCTAA